ncbi:hypothetical protein CRENBAI_022334 [Crenichthys baileyi]|uniref:Uncharacterized protein n=1 Tax=Crenichthys baileyi TaxID=28760 RepID=A0AAV9RQC2_9TELE
MFDGPDGRLFQEEQQERRDPQQEKKPEPKNEEQLEASAAPQNSRRPGKPRLHTLHFHPLPLWLTVCQQNGNRLAQQHANTPLWDWDNSVPQQS